MSRGGSRFGAGRPAYKVTAESVQRIEVRRWSQAGYFNSSFSFSTGWTRGGEPTGNITVSTSRDSAALSYRIKDIRADEWQDKRQLVPVVRTSCNYGGSRNWFQCPACNRRCEVLYLRLSRFACRCCQNIAYTSQSGGPIERLTHKLHKLRERVAHGNLKSMRSATYDRLLEQANETEEVVEQQIAARCLTLFGTQPPW
jgi:hypothetical protein